MLFFGDREREEDPGAVARELAADLDRAASLPAEARHGALAACLVRAGELAQGLADAAEDGGAAARDAEGAMRVATALGAALWRSWTSGGDAPLGRIEPLRPAGGAPIRVRRPEGFSCYALYPETYALAASALSGTRDLAVVGIRSIGTALAAMVAAGAGARDLPLTVRPGGGPFERRVAAGLDALRAAVRPGRSFAIVDEGPGLSGSSFAAVARPLLQLGVAPERIHLFASHANGPGPRADAATRALLAALPTHHVRFEEALLGDGPLALPRLAEDLLGPARLEGDLSAGAWRARACGDPDGWPASSGWLERRKLLLATRRGPVLARFAGLDGEGARKLERARALARAGVGSAPLALRHGLLLEPWLDGAPLPRRAPPRRRLLDAVRRWVRLSSSRPRPAADGAAPPALAELVRVNAAEALGAGAAADARRLEELLPAVSAQARACEVDARPGPWEWLVLADGRIVKTDGLDHASGHELAGCQDALWDVAGAQLALGLDDREANGLAEAARAAAPGADPSLLPFYRAAFAALEVGRWTYALGGEPPGPERARREAALDEARGWLASAVAAVAAPRRGRARRRPATTPR
jgi:hypothetical protein